MKSTIILLLVVAIVIIVWWKLAKEAAKIDQVIEEYYKHQTHG